MKTNTVMRTAAVALLLVIGLTGCGKEESTGLNTNPGDTENTSFTPGEFASNFQKGMVANKFEVTIENVGATELDLSGISITPASGQSTCTDILDGDNNINGAPTDPIAAGSSATFSYGVGCLAKVGEPLDLSVSIGDQVVSVSGTLK